MSATCNVTRWCLPACMQGIAVTLHRRLQSFRKILIFTAIFVVLLTLWVLGYQRLDRNFRIVAVGSHRGRHWKQAHACLQPFLFIFLLHFNKRFLLTSGRT